jgi:hypothetical protein
MVVNKREPREGDAVTATFTGHVEAGPMSDTEFLRVDGERIQLKNASSVTILVPQPQPGDIWDCVIRAVCREHHLFRVEDLVNTSGPRFWTDSAGTSYSDGDVEPIERVYHPS